MREQAPPYANEGPHALWHVSEEPSLEGFVPRVDATAELDEPLELRFVPNLWPLWNQVVASTLEFSGMRLRNAQPLTDQPAK